MVLFYKEAKENKLSKAFAAECTGLDITGRGVVRAGGKIWFVPGFMPGEQGKVQSVSVKGTAGTGKLLRLTKSSPDRCQPDCALQERCGGCPLQHLPENMSLQAKAQGIASLLNKACKSTGLTLTKPDFVISGPQTGYRRACRLSVRASHGRLQLGLRSAFSHEVVALDSCKVLTERINALLPALSELINSFEDRKKTGHVECIDSDGKVGVLLRLTRDATEQDKKLMQQFATEHDCVVSIAEPRFNELERREWLKETCLSTNADDLFLNTCGLKLHFQPSAFVQVNKAVNEALVQKVLDLVQPAPGKKILDLFCGLGNFTFPLAAAGAQVHGVDIVKSMIDTAERNAADNGISTATFAVADLEDKFENQLWAKQKYDAVVLDPGRQGAKRAAAFLTVLRPALIVMISCNPLAASRDCAQLLQHGYSLQSWGCLDMFPRTAHVEMVTVFART